jgi:isoquinoline 1-oxidoreductase beta subunit
MLKEKFFSSRREFIKSVGVLGVGLAVGLDAKANVVNVSKKAVLELEINPFVIIDTAGNITIVNPRPDMGQGTFQSVPSLIAEELEVDLAAVKIVQSDGKSKYGSQTSGGSSSIRSLWLPLRKAGASAKEMLIKAAAQRWNVVETQCYAANAKVFLKGSDKNFSYGELVEAASKLEIPTNPVLKDPEDFKIIGRDIKKLDVPVRVTGKAVYGLDVEVPGMVYASILHSPMLFGKVISVDDSAALKVPGVQRVMKCERKMIHRTTEAVAVVATSWWAALKGREALVVKWDNTGLDQALHTAKYFQECYNAAKSTGLNYEEHHDFKTAWDAATSKLETTYETPFLSHVPVEPENATVHVRQDGSVEIWAPIQGPAETLNEIAAYLNIAPEKIKINAMWLGGSYGRKAYVDFVKEACFISNTLKKPVKLIWTREDDITQGPYRPGMLSHMRGFVEDGKITGYHHHAIGESILGQVFKGLSDGEADPWIGELLSSKNSRYEFETAEKVTWTNVKTEIPIMWWRSVNASNFAWGQECFIDELAYIAGKDPLQARLDIIKDQRFIKVLNTLSEKSNYHSNLPEGAGRGIAIFSSFGSICACSVTVSREGAGVRIDHVVSVIDCGQYVSADIVKAQTEGNIVMGISAAVKGGIIWKNGVCQQSNFTNYHVLRINETPKIEIHIINNGEAPGGVGESGLPPVAPALGNAIFAATGKRIRNLPIDLHKLEFVSGYM